MIAQTFDDGAGSADRERPRERDRQADLARLRLLIAETGTVPRPVPVRAAAVQTAPASVTSPEAPESPESLTSPAHLSSVGSPKSSPARHPRLPTADLEDAEDVPVLPALRPLLPQATLRRGSVVAVEDRVRPWTEAPSYLALALAAGATADGAWCGVVGLPAFGIAAAAGLGADLTRMLMLDEPGERWAEAVAVLAGAVDLILVRPPGRPTAEHVRRITARLRKTARQRGAALVVAGGGWPGANLTLRTTHARWTGLGEGTGHLTGRRVTVAADGRGANGRARSAELWLPAADGSVQTAGAGESGAAGSVPWTPRLDVPSEIREGGEVIRLRSA